VTLTASCRFGYSAIMKIPGYARLPRLRALLKTDGAVAAVYLFGSYARGSPTRTSDIDIAILLHSSIHESQYFSLRLEYIARLMGVLLTERLDVVILNRAPLHLAYEIVTHGTLVVDREPRRRAAFEADCIGRFLDFKPFLATQVEAIKEHLSRGRYFD
jgi:predicted nucleotidyltransferase